MHYSVDLWHLPLFFFYRYNEAKQLEILLAKRKETLKAFPGLWTGIGGKVDASDKAYFENQPEFTTHLDLLKVTAMREVYEELGLLLLLTGVKVDPIPKDGPLARLGINHLELNWDGLVPSGFKQTPEFTLFNPIFKTQFFIYEFNGPEITLPADNHEFDKLAWHSPEEWIEFYETQTIQMPPPVLSLIRTFTNGKSPLEASFINEKRNKLPIGLQTRIEIHPGIFALPLHTQTIKPATTTNAFILGDDDHLFLVDPGSYMESENQRLIKVLEEYAGKKEIRGVLLTHHHIDHFSSIPYLQDNLPYSFPVYAHDNTEDLINNELIHVTPLKDKQILNLGFDNQGNPWKLEVLYTGGHTEDHFVFLDKRFNALLAGDLVVGVGTVLVDNMGEYFKSLNMLLNQTIGVILPGHGPVHYKGKKLLQQYKTHRLARLDLIIEAFHKLNKATVVELTELAYRDVDQQYQKYAQMQMNTYLRYLLDQKRVIKQSETYELVEL